jgi:hypothetical protein
MKELHIGRRRLDAAQYPLDLGQSESIFGGQRATRQPAILLEQPLAKFRRGDSEVDRGSKLQCGVFLGRIV